MTSSIIFLDWWIGKLATAMVEMRDNFVKRTDALCFALGTTNETTTALGVSFSLYHSNRKGVTPISDKMIRKLEAAEALLCESIASPRQPIASEFVVPRMLIEDLETALEILKTSKRAIWLTSAASVLASTASEIAAFLKNSALKQEVAP